jgi:hypothetical protein
LERLKAVQGNRHGVSSTYVIARAKRHYDDEPPELAAKAGHGNTQELNILLDRHCDSQEEDNATWKPDKKRSQTWPGCLAV